ncbi:MAG: hypothetical protein QOF48_2519 [Verrucomicrobiota bacterium]|jgi:hypothetical protein
MNFPIVPLLLAAFVMASSAAEPGLKRYLYLSTPDAAQKGGSGSGILIFDIDDGHRFVRRIDIPKFQEGLRGFCPSLAGHAAYYSTTSRRLGRFDLETEKIVWEKTYNVGCDRCAVTMDGGKIYVPSGWWIKGTNSCWMVVDAGDGHELKRLPANDGPHNTIASLDGRFVFGGSETNFFVFNARNDSLLQRISPVGESGVFPFTVNNDNSLAYICLGKHVGCDVVDLKRGAVLHRVLAGEQPIAHRTHGAALTPDGKELWLSDQDGKKLFVFDAQQMPPSPKGHVDLSTTGHGWICFSLDGKYAWSHTPDIIDAHSKKVVATLKDEKGEPVSGSKFFEAQFLDGKLVRVGNQFGLGRERMKSGVAGF